MAEFTKGYLKGYLLKSAFSPYGYWDFLKSYQLPINYKLIYIKKFLYFILTLI